MDNEKVIEMGMIPAFELDMTMVMVPKGILDLLSAVFRTSIEFDNAIHNHPEESPEVETAAENRIVSMAQCGIALSVWNDIAAKQNAASQTPPSTEIKA